MVDPTKITAKLKVVDQYKFAALVDNLINQGAFPDISPAGVPVDSFGVNIEKQRTIKSPGRADSEIPSLGLKIETSVLEDWPKKLKKELDKYKANPPTKFAFISNQPLKTRQIRIAGKNVKAEIHAKSELGGAEIFLKGLNEICQALQDPKFFYLRRAYLQISDDIFCHPAQFLDELLVVNKYLKCTTPDAELEEIANTVDQEISLQPGTVVLMHNEDFHTLLHTLTRWANKKFLALNNDGEYIKEDFCILRWPSAAKPLDRSEISQLVKTNILIWGMPHQLPNISEYLQFSSPKTSIIIVTKSGFEEELISKIKDYVPDIQEVVLLAIDNRTVTPKEISAHESKIKLIVASTTDLLLRYEALIYIYSPVIVTDGALDKIRTILSISASGEQQLRSTLIDNDLATLTGDVLWLHHPSVSRTLLKRYIEEGIFSIDLLTEIDG